MTLRKRPDPVTVIIKYHLLQIDGDFKIPFLKELYTQTPQVAPWALQNWNLENMRKYSTSSPWSRKGVNWLEFNYKN